MSDEKATTVAKNLVEKVVLRRGVPQQLLTDQGSNFTSKIMKQVCEQLMVKKLQTTAYHPDGNGAVERLHQTLRGLLSHLVARDQHDWDLWIPYGALRI